MRSPEVLIPRAKRTEVAPGVEAFVDAASRLDAISDPVRLQVLWWLARDERSVTDLCALVGMRQQAVTHHLSILRLSRLVAFRRQGRYNLYGLTDAGRETMAAVTPLLP